MAFRHDAATRVYRIVHGRSPPFDGSGTYRWGSRWISPGRQVVHAAETYALAVLENLVHWQTNALLPALVCVEATIPADMQQEQVDDVDPRPLGTLDHAATRAYGDNWHDRRRTAILWVPSAVSPYERNVLFNQAHEDFTMIEIAAPVSAVVDRRLVRKSGGGGG
ncbi:MAG: RES domain-containing protein [Gammaproteobacteria bacterium]|nr:RES domain-containing protein [Gammaproteobacteria bacterium]